MREPHQMLRTLTPAVLAVVVVEAVVSIVASWPHQFGGHGSSSRVTHDFLSGGGTALAPPLLLVVLLAIAAVGLRMRPRAALAATVLLLPVAAVLTVGAFGEAAATATPDVPTAALRIGGAVGAVLSLTLLALAVLTLATHRRRAGRPFAAA